MNIVENLTMHLAKHGGLVGLEMLSQPMGHIQARDMWLVARVYTYAKGMFMTLLSKVSFGYVKWDPLAKLREEVLLQVVLATPTKEDLPIILKLQSILKAPHDFYARWSCYCFSSKQLEVLSKDVGKLKQGWTKQFGMQGTGESRVEQP
jgi:hypothetical protein